MSDNPLLDMPELNDVPMSAPHAISSLALNFALKWIDTSMIKDGTLYQQKKMEGANFHVIDLPDVFDIARQFEAHILSSPGRISAMVIECVGEAIDQIIHEDDAQGIDAGTDETPQEVRPEGQERGPKDAPHD
jgi:hypothetical protein